MTSDLHSDYRVISRGWLVTYGNSSTSDLVSVYLMAGQAKVLDYHHAYCMDIVTSDTWTQHQHVS